MRALKLLISYDGEVFYGMQRQTKSEQPTVQAVIEKSFSEIYRESVSITYAGRTDRGVHAKEQVICFSDDGVIPIQKLKRVLQNSLEGYPIDILSVEESISVTHPRHDALCREYEYWFYTGKENVFLNKYMLYVNSMDIERLNGYAKYLIGEKDFALFCRSADKYENTVRKVEKANFSETTYSLLGYTGHSYVFKVSANGFLHNMVRRMVGLLLHAMKNCWRDEEIKQIVEDEKEYLWQMAPAKGLFLTKVEYLEETKGKGNEK